MGPNRSLTVAAPTVKQTLTMRTYLADCSPPRRLAAAVARKACPGLAGAQWSGRVHRRVPRNRNPTATRLLAESKNTAWTCASINAAVCAGFPPSLYVTTRPDSPGQVPDDVAAGRDAATAARGAESGQRTRAAAHLEEVMDHPLLDLWPMRTW